MAIEPLGRRIQRFRDRRGISLSELARLSGVDKGTLSKAEGGTGWLKRGPSHEAVLRLAKALGVSASELTGEYETDSPLTWSLEDLLDRLGAVVIDDDNEIYLDQRVSAGKGKGVSEDGTQVKRSKRQKLYLVQVEGDCMVPDVADGDMVKFDPDLAPEDGDWVVASIDGDRAMVKEYESIGAVQRLLPLNGEPLIIDENVRIVGVVMGVEKPSPRTRRRRR